MSTVHERVTAALELKEPDRVPVMDVMEEYANIYEILGRKPVSSFPTSTPRGLSTRWPGWSTALT
jgi:hypothetical protein